MIVTLIGGIVMFSLLALDLILKAWAYAYEVSQPNFFLGFIRINYLPGGNPGIAWGMFGDSKGAMIAVTIFTCVMIVGIAALFLFMFKKNAPARICLAVIEAGAVGNLVDRLCLGYVRDFVDVSRLGFNICNFADFYITFGAVALLIVILFIGKDAVIPIGKWRRELRREREAERAKEQAKETSDGTEPPSEPPSEHNGTE